VIIVDGTADVTKNGQRINQLGPGDFLGEIALISARSTHSNGDDDVGESALGPDRSEL